ncbi:chaperone protein dnaJ 20 chloroplastic [Drosophila madeirensis]|uniref:Chaperone protein dnaJ 20 chloroplastic n=1 Tax=Drosophila madeirensis TaxID=30013 RepID=A0AAU9EW47_DROMD
MQRRQSENFYQVLNVPVNSSDQEIKSAFFELSKKYHPDANSQSCDSERFSRLWEAYKTLHRPSTRQHYDNSMNFKQQTGPQLHRCQQNVASAWQKFHTQMRNKQKRSFYNGLAVWRPKTAVTTWLPEKKAVLNTKPGWGTPASLRFNWRLNLCCTGFSLVSGLLILSSLKVWREHNWISAPHKKSSRQDEQSPSVANSSLDLMWSYF